jgi:hypothetical protein
MRERWSKERMLQLQNVEAGEKDDLEFAFGQMVIGRLGSRVAAVKRDSRQGRTAAVLTRKYRRQSEI